MEWIRMCHTSSILFIDDLHSGPGIHIEWCDRDGHGHGDGPRDIEYENNRLRYERYSGMAGRHE